MFILIYVLTSMLGEGGDEFLQHILLQIENNISTAHFQSEVDFPWQGNGGGKVPQIFSEVTPMQNFRTLGQFCRHIEVCT